VQISHVITKALGNPCA